MGAVFLCPATYFSWAFPAAYGNDFLKTMHVPILPDYLRNLTF